MISLNEWYLERSRQEKHLGRGGSERVSGGGGGADGDGLHSLSNAAPPMRRSHSSDRLGHGSGARPTAPFVALYAPAVEEWGSGGGGGGGGGGEQVCLP